MRVTCSCGQTLEIAASFAGRDIQCPACQRHFTMPDAAGAGPGTIPPGTPPQVPAAPEQVVHFGRLQTCATASLWCGIGAMAAYIVMIVLSVVFTLVTRQAGQPHPATPPAVFSLAVLFLTLAAAVLSVLALVLGFFGRKPENTRNRGTGLSGMIIGIIGIGLLLCCMIWVVFLVVAGLKAGRHTHPPKAPAAPTSEPASPGK